MNRFVCSTSSRKDFAYIPIDKLARVRIGSIIKLIDNNNFDLEDLSTVTMLKRHPALKEIGSLYCVLNISESFGGSYNVQEHDREESVFAGAKLRHYNLLIRRFELVEY